MKTTRSIRMANARKYFMSHSICPTEWNTGGGGVFTFLSGKACESDVITVSSPYIGASTLDVIIDPLNTSC